MMLKRSTHEAKPKRASSRVVRAGLAGLLVASASAALATGCLDRKVVSGTPTTSNVFVDQIEQNAVDKIDLLFMIDNSSSMRDKQEILLTAVPLLLNRLADPICLDATGVPTGTSANAQGQCATGSPEFTPINDIHVGIVTSSLGSHGGTGYCQDLANYHNDDHGELIGVTRTGLTSQNNLGFLAWDPSQMKNTPPGIANIADLDTQFAAMLQATGENGCGFESQLEGWYRFLIDPEPPASVVLVPQGMGQVSQRQGTDANVLAQRAAFLRPDSLVAIIMLTDENDCSIQDSGSGWIVSTSALLPAATGACAQDPNSICCTSCGVNAPLPSQCTPVGQDPACSANSKLTAATDPPNMRCYNQKQRFGFDFLYPTQRYVNGLTAQTIARPSDGMMVTNPLFDPGTSGKAPRSPSLVFLAGIVGVPWQDIATADSLTSPTALTYLTADELTAQGRWAQILGKSGAGTTNAPGATVPPTDPFMIESIPTRMTGAKNPNINDSIAAANSTSPQASKINGHEWNSSGNDLQFACIFPLATPKVCQPTVGSMTAIPCDCQPESGGTTVAVTTANSPLCQPPAGGAPGTTQYYAKGYPGVRELTVLQGIGSNAIVASICPKVTTSANPASDLSFGYNPAVSAIIDRLKVQLKGQCLPRAIQTDPTTGLVECQVIEVTKKDGACGACDQLGRSPAPAAIHTAVFSQLQSSKECGTGMQPPCDDTGYCLCQIDQETGADLTACQADTGAPPAGYCYVDDKVAPNSPLLAGCADNQKRILRFVDAPDGSVKTPAQGAIAFIACVGAAIDSTTTATN